MRLRTVSALAAAIGLLAACGADPSPPPPSPTTTATSAVTTTTSSVPAPLARFVADPCALLTDAQRTALGERGFPLRPGMADHPNSGRYVCDYVPQGTDPIPYFVMIFIKPSSGLAGLADSHAKGFSPEYWKPDTLAGHPVIYYTIARASEFCSVAIGITDTSYVGVDLQKVNGASSREKGSCVATTAVAEQVLATIDGEK